MAQNPRAAPWVLSGPHPPGASPVTAGAPAPELGFTPALPGYTPLYPPISMGSQRRPALKTNHSPIPRRNYPPPKGMTELLPDMRETALLSKCTQQLMHLFFLSLNYTSNTVPLARQREEPSALGFLHVGWGGASATSLSPFMISNLLLPSFSLRRQLPYIHSSRIKDAEAPA